MEKRCAFLATLNSKRMKLFGDWSQWWKEQSMQDGRERCPISEVARTAPGDDQPRSKMQWMILYYYYHHHSDRLTDLTKVSQYHSIWLAPSTSKKQLLIVLQFCHSYGFLPSRIFQSASSELKHFYWISDWGRQNNIVLSYLVFCTRQNNIKFNSIQFND